MQREDSTRLTGNRPDSAEANQAERCFDRGWEKSDASECTNCDPEYKSYNYVGQALSTE